jgi:hypothetical protein
LKVGNHKHIDNRKCMSYKKLKLKELNSVALVRERTRPSDRRLSAKLVPTFVDRGCRVVSATDPTAVFSAFYTGTATIFFQVAPHS